MCIRDRNIGYHETYIPYWNPQDKGYLIHINEYILSSIMSLSFKYCCENFHKDLGLSRRGPINPPTKAKIHSADPFKIDLNWRNQMIQSFQY